MSERANGRKGESQWSSDHDAASREALEERLDNYKRQVKAIFSLSSVGMAQAEPSTGELVRVNQKLCRMLGYSETELLNKTFRDFTHPDDRQADWEGFSKAAQSQDPYYRVEKRYVRNDGGIIWVDVSVNFLRDENGQAYLTVAVINDITEKKRAEETLRRGRVELKKLVRQRTAKLNASRNELRRKTIQLQKLASHLTLAEQQERQRIAKVLHDDLQQVIAGVKYQLDHFRSRLNDSEARDEIEQIHNLLNESIETSRTLTAELAPPALHEGQLVDGIKWLAAWMKQKHKLTVHFHHEDSEELLSKDMKILLFESIREILFNIIKHSGVDEANIFLNQRQNELEALITDKGSGFDVEAMWQRSAREGKTFGLASIRDRLHIFGGQMEITSAPGEGSRFRLIVPLKSKPEATEESTIITKVKVKPPTQKFAKRKTETIRVMLVDDHTVIRKGLSSLLSRQKDIEIVAEASDGDEAIEKADQFHPDLILMDFRMPRMDGLQATKIIHSQYPDIRIIGLSMYDESKIANSMKEAGASACLSKSGPAEQLLDEIIKQKK